MGRLLRMPATARKKCIIMHNMDSKGKVGAQVINLMENMLETEGTVLLGATIEMALKKIKEKTSNTYITSEITCRSSDPAART